MSSGFLNGINQNAVLSRGVNRIAIGSSAQLLDVVVTPPDQVQIQETGDYSLEVLLWCIGRGQDVQFDLQLWNDTLGVVEQEIRKVAPNNGRENLVEYIFDLTVANAAHQWVLRANVLDGDLTQAMDLVGTPDRETFRARLLAGASEGTVGPGTTNNIAKFTGAQTVGDSRITDDGINPIQPNAPVNMTDEQLQRPVIRDYGMTTVQVAASGANLDLDCEAGNTHEVVMDQNCVFTFSNPPAAGTYGKIILLLSGAFVPTFPGTVRWPGGVAPPYATPSLYAFVTFDAGANWYGSQAGNAYA